MAEFFLVSSGFVLLDGGARSGARVARTADVDRVMAAQLLGTGGIAGLLLLGAATATAAAIDVALTLALLAAFVSIAFVKATQANDGAETDSADERR